MFAPFHTFAPKCFPLPCSPPPLFTLFFPLQFSWVPVSHPYPFNHNPSSYPPPALSIHKCQPVLFSHPQPPLLYAALFSQTNQAETQCTCVSVGHLSLSLSDVLHLSAVLFKSKQRHLIKLSGVIHTFWSLKSSHHSPSSKMHGHDLHTHTHTSPSPRWQQHFVQDWSVLVDASFIEEDKMHVTMGTFFSRQPPQPGGLPNLCYGTAVNL